MGPAPILLLGAWALWCALHSLLVSPGPTRFLQHQLGAGFRFLRLGYVLFSTVTLVPLAGLTARLDRQVVFAWSGPLRFVALAGLLVSASLFLAGARHYDPWVFLGIRQARSGTSHRSLLAENRLDTSGILGVIRHPWYSATFLLLWCRPLTLLSIEVGLLLSLYLIVGTRLEERKLLAEFGDGYRAYRERVSPFLPVKWLRRRVSGGSRAV